jgi:asparagine synthase (glutamine-hydrolysing)
VKGWIGVATPEPQAALARMGATAGLAESHAALGGAADIDGVWASWQGHPRWRDADLDALALRRGHAHALAHAFRSFGDQLLDRLAGPFAIAVIEPAKRRLLAAIDRAGVHTLCYAPLPGGVVFGTTTEPVRRHPLVGSTLSPQALFDYFHFVDRIPAPGTIYREQRKLAPGEMLSVEDGKVAVRPYWRMRYVPDRRTGNAELAEKLRATLAAAVRTSLGGEAPERTGAFLSGGLDSSTVCGLLAQSRDRAADAFTIAFDHPRYDESRYARLAACHFGLRHHVRTVGPGDVADIFTKVAAAYDEPFANSSAVPAYFCALAAREAGMDTLLAGDGGDELFAGNARYVEDRVFQRYGLLPEALRRRVIEPLAKVVPSRKLARYVGLARLPLPVRAISDTIFDGNAEEAVFSPDLLAQVDHEAPARLAGEIFAAAPEGDDLQRFMLLDLRLTLADSDLRKVTRMAELAGLRVRFPMLEDDVLEFSGTLPSRLLCPGDRLRGFYKDAFAKLLPRDIITKPKHGFGLPFEEYLQSHKPLRDFASEALRSLGRRGFLNPAFLDRMARSLSYGDAPPMPGVWDMACLEVWLSSRAAP